MEVFILRSPTEETRRKAKSAVKTKFVAGHTRAFDVKSCMTGRALDAILVASSRSRTRATLDSYRRSPTGRSI